MLTRQSLEIAHEMITLHGPDARIMAYFDLEVSIRQRNDVNAAFFSQILEAVSMIQIDERPPHYPVH